MPFPAGANVRPSNLGQPFLHKTRFPPLPNLKDIQRDPNLPKENVPKPIPDAPRSQGSIPKPPPPQSAAPPQAAPQSPPTPQAYAEPPPRPPGSVPSAPPSNNINTGVGVGAGGAVGAVSTIGGVNPVSLGIVAGTIWISNSYQLLKLWRLSQPESKPVERELYGGNKPNTYYTISGEITEVCATKKDFSDGIEVTWYWENAVADGNFGFGGGPLAGVIELKSKPSEFLYGGHTSYGVHFKTGDFPDVVVMANKGNTAKHVSEYNRGFCRLIKVSLIAQPIGEAPVEKPQPIMQQSPPQRIPSLNNQPPSNQPSNQPQLQLQQPPLNNFPEKPPYAEPTPQSRQQPIKIAVPPNQPIQISSPNSPPILVNPPQPNQPSNINISNNQPTGQPRNITINQPGGNPVSFSLPGANPLTINIPGQKPITINPGQAQPANTVKPLLDPTTLVPEPITGGSTPIKNSTTPLNPTNVGTNNKGESVNFKPQPKPSFQPQPQPKPIEEPEPKPVDPFFPFPSPEVAGLAAITPILQQLLNQTSPESMANAAATGTCRTTQPNGCNRKMMDEAVNNINNNTNKKVDGLGLGNLLAQLADLALLRVINNKLGDQMTGGLSGGLGRLSKFLGIDRLFNLLNFLATLHNASMLSASLKVTLLETLSSVANATGLLQTSENENVDLNAVFNQGVEGLVVSLIGAEAWASMKLSWRKYSSIYRAGSNVLSNVGNMFSSIGNGIEVAAEHTGKIGNALRAAGVVRENAYNFMAENVSVHTNKFMTFQTKIGGVTEVLEAINEVAESTIEGQQAYTEAVKATAEFQKQLAEAEKNPGIENKLIAAEAAKIKENISKDPTGEKEEGYLSFLTD